MILCADVGATKTLLGLAVPDGPSGVKVLVSHRYLAIQVPSFEAMVAGFLQEVRPVLTQPLTAACFGIAGPVTGHTVQMTNLPWRVDARAMSRQLGGIPVQLVNDFRAAASGIDVLDPDELASLQDGQAEVGAPQLVIGAGTGLGVAYRFWQGDRYDVAPGEGGHIGFSPANAEQDTAMARLRPHVGRVVAEHFVSGQGLVNFHTHLAWASEASPDVTPALMGEEVFRRATQEGDARALHALHHFLLAYGAVAGDHALSILARGGVFLAGGIAQKCLPYMQDGQFMAGFRQKGVYEPLVSTFPVHVVMQPDLGLRGAAVLGARLRS
ncbi:MAG: glucokinase [Burkholderiales bacterium]|nr:glucokinase [Burkholderiales bacterium]